jgi:hypothetical protein
MRDAHRYRAKREAAKRAVASSADDDRGCTPAQRFLADRFGGHAQAHRGFRLNARLREKRSARAGASWRLSFVQQRRASIAPDIERRAGPQRERTPLHIENNDGQAISLACVTG